MPKPILTELEAFRRETGLSEHRIGIIIANNGRLFERMRSNGRVWPETEALIRASLAAERAKRRAKKTSGAAA